MEDELTWEQDLFWEGMMPGVCMCVRVEGKAVHNTCVPYISPVTTSLQEERWFREKQKS